jgi:hypothetical protein
VTYMLAHLPGPVSRISRQRGAYDPFVSSPTHNASSLQVTVSDSPVRLSSRNPPPRLVPLSLGPFNRNPFIVPRENAADSRSWSLGDLPIPQNLQHTPFKTSLRCWMACTSTTGLNSQRLIKYFRADALLDSPFDEFRNLQVRNLREFNSNNPKSCLAFRNFKGPDDDISIICVLRLFCDRLSAFLGPCSNACERCDHGTFHFSIIFYLHNDDRNCDCSQLSNSHRHVHSIMFEHPHLTTIELPHSLFEV